MGNPPNAIRDRGQAKTLLKKFTITITPTY